MAFSRFPERESIVSRPMFVAAANGEISKIEQLLAKGVDVNCIHKATGRTPLIEATIANQLGAVRALLVAGANINHQDTAVGYSALMWASGNGNAEIVKCLLEAGAEMDARLRDWIAKSSGKPGITRTRASTGQPSGFPAPRCGTSSRTCSGPSPTMLR